MSKNTSDAHVFAPYILPSPVETDLTIFAATADSLADGDPDERHLRDAAFLVSPVVDVPTDTDPVTPSFFRPF